MVYYHILLYNITLVTIILQHILSFYDYYYVILYHNLILYYILLYWLLLYNTISYYIALRRSIKKYNIVRNIIVQDHIMKYYTVIYFVYSWRRRFSKQNMALLWIIFYQTYYELSINLFELFLSIFFYQTWRTSSKFKLYLL